MTKLSTDTFMNGPEMQNAGDCLLKDAWEERSDVERIEWIQGELACAASDVGIEALDHPIAAIRALSAVASASGRENILLKREIRELKQQMASAHQ